MASAFFPTSGGSRPQAAGDGGSNSPDAKESTTISFEWTVRGLKNLFESSKGETKSKVTKSPRFGDGRWQIMFYANSGIVGTEGQIFVSVYLACEPTIAEKESGVNGKWSRDGLFNFSFEIRSLNKVVQFNMKEAHNHSFYYPGAQNWGWAQFARRDAIQQHNTVRQNDAVVIICSITSSPASPAPVPAIPRHSVPKDLLDTVGSLLDDPVCSDVEFVLPQLRRGESRSIYASQKLLRRVEYFSDMFSSGFAEGSSHGSAGLDHGVQPDENSHDDASVSDTAAFAQQFDDSDFEDDEDSVVLNNDQELTVEAPQRLTDGTSQIIVASDDGSVPDEASGGKRRADDEEPSESDRQEQNNNGDDHDAYQTQRKTRPKLSHPSSPRSRLTPLEDTQVEPISSTLDQACFIRPGPSHAVPGPKKVRVVVRDVAYATYRAVLYYIYTDMIVFAPLSSTFSTITSFPPVQAGGSVVSTPSALPTETHWPFGLAGLGARANHQQPSETTASSSSSLVGPRTRKEWLAEWVRNNPGRPQPPSAKSVYRLADRLGLQELKERAFKHIIKSLTVENVAYEAFSAFAAAFEDVRKVEIAFMFDHWMDVRKGALLNIGQQLRLGKLPGFEEVWPMIIQNLVAEDKKGSGEADGSRS
ncbi:hypothetical protein BD414DRAFT_421643 [Trametes punicea]|nr:hypothetical protein BD414DRAFT_421643 [Trametes punicea]